MSTHPTSPRISLPWFDIQYLGKCCSRWGAILISCYNLWTEINLHATSLIKSTYWQNITKRNKAFAITDWESAESAFVISINVQIGRDPHSSESRVVYYLIWDLERIVDVSRWFWKRLSTILKRLKRLTRLKSSTVSILCSLNSDFKDFDRFTSEIFPKTEIAVAIILQSTQRKLFKANRNDFSTILKRLSRVKSDDSLKTVRALLDVLWPSPLTRKPSIHKTTSTLPSYF